MIPIPLLLSAGPTLLRMAGSLFGGKTKQVAEATAGILDSVKGKPPVEAEAIVKDALAKVPEGDLLELMKVIGETERVKAEQATAREQAVTDRHVATQETARVEAQSQDAMVRQTRPGIAKQSAMVTFTYGLSTELLFPLIEVWKNVEGLPSADWQILMALFSPCLTYMGARSAESFSKGGKSGGSGALASLTKMLGDR